MESKKPVYQIFNMENKPKSEKKDHINQEQLQEIKQVPGLSYKKGFISEKEEGFILSEIRKMPWNTQLKRRTQHYGYKYDYTSKSIDESDYLGPLPDFCDTIIKRMLEQKIIEEQPDQLIINEYEPGQGISPHIDKTDFFKDTIISISLGSFCIMDFTKEDKTKQKDGKNIIEEVNVALARRSLVKLSKEARYIWKHGIKARKSDKTKDGMSIQRSLRISLTFRNIQRKKIKLE